MNTKPELALRRALHARGYRYRKDYRLDLAEGVRVRPDIVFTRRKVAIFVDGCFWHCCPEHGSQPAANSWYWEPKLRRNVERDHAADAALGVAGWTVVRFWEHESIDAAIAQLVRVLGLAPAAKSGVVIVSSDGDSLQRDASCGDSPPPGDGGWQTLQALPRSRRSRSAQAQPRQPEPAGPPA